MDWLAVERAALVLDVVSGVAFALLGAWVLTLRPRSPLATVLGAFCIGKGVQVAVGNAVTEIGWLPAAWTGLTAAGAAVAGGSLLVLALRFPLPVPASERRRLAPLPLSVVVLFAVTFGLAPAFVTFASPLDEGAWIVVYALTWTALAILALRFAKVPADADRRGIVFVTAALGLEVLLRTGGLAVKVAVGVQAATSTEPLPFFASAALLLALWLRNTAVAPPEARKTARDVTLFLAALLPAGALFASATDPAIAFNLGVMGGARVVGILLLAFAILRLQLLGLDVRVRWGISKSTVAAVFIAVFFVASEGAQAFLGETTGSTYAGIAAAGALVFALAPLQRAAERLAEKAVPVADLSTGGDLKEERFRAALRMAIGDRALTREEERTLVLLALDLGIQAERAYALVDESVSAARTRREEAPA